MKEVVILSVDGGGMKGLIPALILHYLHNKLSKVHPGKHLYQYFDMVAGTSTGGLIALGISTPLVSGGMTRIPKFSTDALIQLYTEKGKNIFVRSDKTWKKRFSALYKYKYTSDHLLSIMDELYGESRLSDSFIPSLITSFDTWNLRPHIFKSHITANEKNAAIDYHIRDVARATTAAPVFFPPVELTTIEKNPQKLSLVDGGVFANNPSLLALTEAKKIYPQAEKYIVLSLGTGSSKKGYSYKEIANWGAYQWMAPNKNLPLFNIMMTGQAETVDHTMHNLPEVEYFRINPIIEPEKDILDDVNPQNLRYLGEQAKKLLTENKPLFYKILGKLSQKLRTKSM